MDVENGLVNVRDKGSRKNWEIGTDIYTLPCVKQLASGNLLYGAGSSVLCSVRT